MEDGKLAGVKRNRLENKFGKRRRSAEEIEAVLAGYEESGLPQGKFAREMGIGVSTLQYWLRRRRAAAPSIPLLELKVAKRFEEEAGCGEKGVYEIAVGSAMRLRVPAAFNEEAVGRLLRTMKEVVEC